MFIPEKFVKHIWKNQRLRSSYLKTIDNQFLQVFSVGTMNQHAGPDFLNAKICFNHSSVIEGDIEIHSLSSGWKKHRHDENDQYQNVILNVVFENDMLLTNAPTLELKSFLNDDFHKVISDCIRDESMQSKTFPCYPLNLDISLDSRIDFLEHLAHTRLERKGFELVRSEKDISYAMLRGIAIGLGYSANLIPFEKLWEKIKTIFSFSSSKMTFIKQRDFFERALFYFSGLVPCSKTFVDDLEKKYITDLLSFELEEKTFIAPLEKREWKFFRLRPSNFPPLRIAGFAELIARHIQKPLFDQCLDILRSTLPPAKIFRHLESLFIVEAFGYWKTHYDFLKSTSSIKTLIGKSRSSDIVLNTVLPIFYQYAKEKKDDFLRDITFKIFQDYPKQVSASISLDVIEKFLGDDISVRSGFIEQGILELEKTYCSKFECLKCKVGQAIFRKSSG